MELIPLLRALVLPTCPSEQSRRAAGLEVKRNGGGISPGRG